MRTFLLSAETAHRAGTIMTWPTRHSIIIPTWSYPGANVSQTHIELANLARTIAKYEPVQLFVRDPKSYPSNKNDECGFNAAHDLLGTVENVTIHVTPNVDSLWARDNGAIFVRSTDGESIDNTWGLYDDPGVGFKRINTSSTTVGMLLSFNQWGRKLPPTVESYIAAEMAQVMNLSSVLAPFTGEGGAIEVDGEGTMIATESSLLNPNRNPGIDKDVLEKYLSDAFGVKKTLWIPGVRGEDITDDHIDSLARFGGLDKDGCRIVFLDRYYVPNNASAEEEAEILADFEDAKALLENNTDAKGRRIKTVTGRPVRLIRLHSADLILTYISVQEPDPDKVLGKDNHPSAGPSVSYVNFHVVNGAVVMSKFGDEELDAAAAKIIGEQYPGRQVEQVYTHQLAIQGGGIHCSTQQYYL